METTILIIQCLHLVMLNINETCEQRIPFTSCNLQSVVKNSDEVLKCERLL